MPSVIPTTTPTSALPTSAPSITGSVVFIEMNTIVTSSLSNEEIADFISIAENVFGVNPGKVDAEVIYDIVGTFEISADGDYTEDELISALQSSIADTLNIHPSDVAVEIDADTGVSTYTITSNSVDDAMNLQELLQDTSTSDDISSQVESIVPGITNVTTLFNGVNTVCVLR